MEIHLVKWHPGVAEQFIFGSLKHIRVVKEKIKLVEWSSGNGRVWTNCWQFWNLSNDNWGSLNYFITNSSLKHIRWCKKDKARRAAKMDVFHPLLTKLCLKHECTRTHTCMCGTNVLSCSASLSLQLYCTRSGALLAWKLAVIEHLIWRVVKED